jgi:UDP-N-acetylmuramoyl-tripeptide--D-alanyl-D-alanine ligase
MHWTVSKLLEAVHGRLIQGDPARTVAHISTDTRQLRPDDCFVALAGENFDGHDFLRDAASKGVAAIVVSKRPVGLDGTNAARPAVIEVPDTLYALGELARSYRARFSIPVIGITGSNGKTSTKEMIASILSQRHKVLKNKGNFNNLIGVPLTLLTMLPEHEVALVEMGINVPGEMARLVEISSPTVGLITNIHPAHLAGLGSLDRIVEEKGKLWRGLGSNDLAVVNLDDDRLSRLSEEIGARAITYSLKDPRAQVKPVGEIQTRNGASAITLAMGEEQVRIDLKVLGMHQVQNAVAAAALAWGMGESPETIERGLSMHTPVSQRMQTRSLGDRGILIDDTYNANPGSMLAAVHAALSASNGSPLIAVLGEMRELGPESESLHRDVGRRIGKLGLGMLVTLGELAEEIGKGAREVGMDASLCIHASSHAEIVEWLAKNRPPDSWILVKGSRGMRMEKVVEGVLSR